MKIYAAARTDVGKIRELNEDNYFSSEKERFFLVADGMGGHAAGEIASDIAARVVSGFFLDHTSTETPSEETLVDAIQAANRLIFEEASSSDERKGMGTTIVTSYFYDGSAVIGHVGDSRAYLVRNGLIECLTEDHSWVNIQVRMGNITKEQAVYHPLKNIITKALGIQEDVEVDLTKMTVKHGDYLVLCSDGLTGMVDDDTIREIILDDETFPSLEDKVEGLVQEALDNGGEDNVTVVIMRIELESPTNLDDTQPILLQTVPPELLDEADDEDTEATVILDPDKIDNKALGLDDPVDTTSDHVPPPTPEE